MPEWVPCQGLLQESECYNDKLETLEIQAQREVTTRLQLKSACADHSQPRTSCGKANGPADCLGNVESLADRSDPFQKRLQGD